MKGPTSAEKIALLKAVMRSTSVRSAGVRRIQAIAEWLGFA